MKRTIPLSVRVGVILVILVIGVRLFHLGPFGIHSGDEVLLAHLKAANGVEFFVVGQRNEELIKAWSVNLYRIDSDDVGYVYYLEHKSSYYWCCSLRENRDTGEIDIWADGQRGARYLPSRNEVMLLDGRNRNSSAMATHGWNLRASIRHAKGHK